MVQTRFGAKLNAPSPSIERYGLKLDQLPHEIVSHLIRIITQGIREDVDATRHHTTKEITVETAFYRAIHILQTWDSTAEAHFALGIHCIPPTSTLTFFAFPDAYLEMEDPTPQDKHFDASVRREVAITRGLLEQLGEQGISLNSAQLMNRHYLFQCKDRDRECIHNAMDMIHHITKANARYEIESKTLSTRAKLTCTARMWGPHTDYSPTARLQWQLPYNRLHPNAANHIDIWRETLQWKHRLEPSPYEAELTVATALYSTKCTQFPLQHRSISISP